MAAKNMTPYFKALRTKSRIIHAIATWQESVAYPIFYAILCAVSGSFDRFVYLPLIALQMLLFLFAVLFTKDNRVFLVPIFMAFYSLGCDHPEFLYDRRDALAGVFEPSALAAAIAMGVVMFSALIVRMTLDGTLTAAFKRRSPVLVGILVLDAAFMLNGMFSNSRTLMDTVFGLLFALGFTVFYCLISSLLSRSEKPTAYACICMTCTAWLILIQLVVQMFRLHEAGHLLMESATGATRLAREYIQLSWGYATNIAGLLILGIPTALYLSRNARFSLVSFGSAACFWLGALATGTRNAFFVGLVIFLIALGLGCFGGKNSKLIRLYTVIGILCAVLVLLYTNKNIRILSSVWENVQNIFRLNYTDIFDSSRLELWANGIRDFLSAPIFGVGFSNGGYIAPTPKSNVFNDMYHNIIVECLGAMGICGMIALLWHIKDVAVLIFRRFTVNKLLVMLLPLTVLLTSLLDNFFFYLNFQIFYCAFLVLAEHDTPDHDHSAILQNKNI